jgi:hypothetical protein
MTTLLDVQRACIARGESLEPYGADGDPGPTTFGAIMRLLEQVPLVAPKPAPSIASTTRIALPDVWMPWAKMQRIIVHWTAGNHIASADDRKHYHFLIDGTGKVVRGTPSVDLNQAPVKKGYAAHTLNCNSGSIGVSLCCMASAVESPFKAGTAPMTREQWEALPGVLADLCRRYAIPVGPATVLSHAEVQGTLGIKQKGKWDIARLAFDPSIVGAKAIGDRFRAATKALL